MRGAGSAFLCADLDLTPEIQDDFLLLASGASRSQVSIDLPTAPLTQAAHPRKTAASRRRKANSRERQVRT